MALKMRPVDNGDFETYKKIGVIPKITSPIPVSRGIQGVRRIKNEATDGEIISEIMAAEPPSINTLALTIIRMKFNFNQGVTHLLASVVTSFPIA